MAEELSIPTISAPLRAISAVSCPVPHPTSRIRCPARGANSSSSSFPYSHTKEWLDSYRPGFQSWVTSVLVLVGHRPLKGYRALRAELLVRLEFDLVPG